VHTRVTRVPFLAAAIGVIALLAAGCTPSGNSASGGGASGSRPKPVAAPSPRQALLLAAHSSEKVNSLDADISVQASTSASGSFSLSGSFKEQVHPSLLAEMDIPTFSTGGQTISGGLTEIITPSAFYMRLGELMQELNTNKQWAEIPLSALGGGAGSTLQSLFSQIQSSSPVSQTQLLSTSKDVRKVGTSVIDGVPVTEYAGSVSMSQALASLPASERSALGGDISASGIKSARFEIWIDGQNLPKKVVMTESGSSLSETITMNIISYNQPVTVQVPPAAQTYVLSASDLGGATS
jgi:hypothetical protein